MKRLMLGLATALVACAGASPPPSAPSSAGRTLRFSFVQMGHVAGGSVVTVRADGARDATWEFNDRGRGPKQETHYEVGPGKTLTRLDVTGVSYLKKPVDEHFATTGDKATWRNSAERGEVAAGSPAMYVALEGAPDLLAATARALLAAPGQELPLLPYGRARIVRAGDATVQAGGRSMHVVRYELVGFEFEPSSLWLDDEGELFASASVWASLVREGWESTIPELVSAQREAQSTRLAALATKLSRRPPAAGMAIVHARLFDPEQKRVEPDATIVWKGDRIVAVGPGASVAVPAGAETIDAKGKTAIAGLWDMHAHVSAGDGLLEIANGVLGARDLGNEMASTLRTKSAWDSGAQIGPRLVLAGIIDGRGPFQAPTNVFADTEAEGLAAVATYASNGYEQIKLYSSLAPALVAPLAASAHQRGLRVSGHIPFGMNAEEAVRAGYDEIQHANFLFLNFLAAKDDDTRTPLRFVRVAEKGAGLDLASPEVQRFVKLLLEHKTVIDPTLGVFEEMFLARAGEVAPGLRPVADRLPVQVRRSAMTGALPVPEGMDATYRASFAKLKSFVKMLHDAGVRVVAGTDTLAGFGLHRELELYVEAGIPAAEVIALATIGAARVMKHEADYGTVAPGKYADLVLFDGRPDVRIEDVRKVASVVKGGVVFPPGEILDALGVGR